MNIFNRVFDRNDVGRPIVVQVADERSQGGGLAGACGARNQDKAFRAERHLPHLIRDFQGVKVRNRLGEPAHCQQAFARVRAPEVTPDTKAVNLARVVRVATLVKTSHKLFPRLPRHELGKGKDFFFGRNRVSRFASHTTIGSRPGMSIRLDV